MIELQSYKGPNKPSRTNEQFQVAHAFDDMLDQCQWISSNDLKQLQNAALTNIVLHALNTVPFYQNRLSCLINESGQIDLANWNKVQFLTREDIQNNFDTLKSTKCPPTHGEIRKARSSGSTAQPVEILTTSLADVASLAGDSRGMEWAGLDFDVDLAQIIPMASVDAPYPGKSFDLSWAPFWKRGGAKGKLHRLDHVTDHHLQLEWLNKIGRCYLNTMPTNLAELMRLVEENPGLRPDLAGILSVGERITAEVRERAEAVLGTKIYNTYSSEEFGNMAWQCPASQNLHVSDELFLLEIVDIETKQPCKHGEIGHLVITSFNNQAMPLIRYKLGDVGRLEQSCKCGRNLTAISDIVGRSRQIFHMPDGTTRMPGLQSSLFVELLKARKWQVAQVGRNLIEIRFVSDSKDHAANHDEFVRQANLRFKQELKYTFKQVEEIPPQPSGKFFEYVCELSL